MVKNLGIITAIGTNSSAALLISKIDTFPLKFFFDKTNPDIVDIMMDKKTTDKVTIKLLTTYLLKGIPEAFANLNRLSKFSKVGFSTKNLGGKAYNSSSGLNA